MIKKPQQKTIDADLFMRFYEAEIDTDPQYTDKSRRDIMVSMYAYLACDGDFSAASRCLWEAEQRVREREKAEAARIAEEYGDE